MAQQKLYTEEQVREVLSNMLLTTEQVESIFEELTPIELPSDEEIRQEGLSNFPNSEYVDRSNDRLAYYVGAKWMKEQILNQNK